MKPLYFLARHPPTDRQRVLARRIGFDDLRQEHVTFDEDPVACVQRLGLHPGDTLALVAPLFVGLTLLRRGYRLVEFINDPTARDRGDFACVGVYTHSLSDSQFVAAEA